jgi:hypothetical protein
LGVKTALANTNCDQIWVAKGVYLAGADRADTFQLRSGLALYGGFAGGEDSPDKRDIMANETILSGNVGAWDVETDNNYQVVTGSGVDYTAVLDGFTVSGGYASGAAPLNKGGGMVNVAGDPTIRNVIFENNFAILGGGMYNEDSEAALAGVLFDSNTAAGGGGMYNHNSDISLVNGTFVGNFANNGGAIYNSYSDPTLTNLTISDNEASIYGGGLYDHWSKPAVNNTIFWGNTAGTSGEQIYEGDGGAAVVAYSVVEDGFVGGSKIIITDPKLGALGDYGGRMPAIPLIYGSSAVDKGNSNVCPYADQRSFPRTGQGSGCDIGAYEYQPVLYVATDGRISGFCHSWSFACTFQHALANADRAQQIWVKYGVYKPSGKDRAASFVLPAAVGVYGGFAGRETAVDQRNLDTYTSTLSGNTGAHGDDRDNSFHVVRIKGAYYGLDTILDGFTIIDGNANGSDSNAFGGGMLLDGANPILRNLVFSGNNAFHGGGLAAITYSAPDLKGVTFDGNSASTGGGMYASESNSGLADVAFNENAASGDGGGMANIDGSLDLIDVVFSKNTAGGNGGGLDVINSTGTLETVTFTGNTAESSGGGMNSYFRNAFTLTQVEFTSNEAAKGGGLADKLSSLQLATVSFNSNVAAVTGGGLHETDGSPTVSGADFFRNRAGAGGGIYLGQGSPMLSLVTFAENEAIKVAENEFSADGGGLLATAKSAPTLTDVSFIGNSADGNGGGMADVEGSDTIIRTVTFEANTAYWGGGLYIYNSNPDLENVTFAGNGADEGGGLYADYSDMQLNHVTFSRNTADWQGPAMTLSLCEKPQIRNSVFWENYAGGRPDIDNDPAYSGWGSQSLRGSVIKGGCPDDMSCTNIITDDPLLGPLGAYGGKTEMFPLGNGSSAIDAAESATCAEFDQRRVERPQNGLCDAGAFEGRFYELRVDKGGDGFGAVAGDGIYCGGLCRKSYVEGAQVTLTASPSAASFFKGWGGACSGTGPCIVTMRDAQEVTADFDLIPPGTHRLIVNLAGHDPGAVRGEGINCYDGEGADCTELYAEDTEVTLTAGAGATSVFSDWSGDCDGTGPCVVTMSQAREVTATFVAGDNYVFLPLLTR